MADFTIRIELHGATRQDYSDLEEELSNVGVVDYIKGMAGNWYRLPPAEYTYTHPTQTAADVYRLVHAIAKVIKPKPAVFVTKSAGRAFAGLEEIGDPT